MEDKKQRNRPKRIFINDIHKYSSKYIAQFLAGCNVKESSEDEGSETEAASSSRPAQPAFEIVGTSLDSPEQEAKQRNFPFKLYCSPTRDELLQVLLQCDVVVYNISESLTKQEIEEATWAITGKKLDCHHFQSRKMFILVSTVMTWALTKPRDSEDPDAFLTEEDFRRRRQLPKFRDHYRLENDVLKLRKVKKCKILSYVVASGLQYGKEENLFHYFFKMSWLMRLPEVPLFGPGTNYVPMIHVHDLAGVLQNVIELKPRSKYILAVDDSKNTLEEVAKVISETLGSGKLRKLPEDEATSTAAFQPEEWACLSIDLRLEAFIIKDSFNIEWRYEDGLVSNIESIVEEFKEARQLLPVRIFLFGPPAVGKTTVAQKLCHLYKIQHITINEVTEEKVTHWKAIVDASEHFSEKEVAGAQAALDNIKEHWEINGGQLPEHQLFEILQEKLNSNPCRNQGFVLDGFPNTYDQAKSIFSDEDALDQDRRFQQPVCNQEITPEHIFVLDGPDDFLIKRVQGLPQSAVERTLYTQEEFLSRLQRYRQLGASYDSVVDYFDELEIHPEYIDVSTADPEYRNVVKTITELVGQPKNYGLSPEELEQEERRLKEEEDQKLALEAAERKHRNEVALAEMALQYEQWQKDLVEVKSQEEELEEALALPLRNYLMKNVIPPLSEALLDCSKIKPEDPVNFLVLPHCRALIKVIGSNDSCHCQTIPAELWVTPAVSASRRGGCSQPRHDPLVELQLGDEEQPCSFTSSS
ncbi:hypothetical protein fugu_017407 [Takifugu bimaculatus]|uniref:Uncharacterized protein n=1 Tax=Takifugu bimaculatus TaxID=433685 RepID=A0A4Z2BSE4_9TELE|nr:hypothetical protein fugu_017407 [Takifugu bimaculatus]